MMGSGAGDDPDMTVADEYNLSYSIEPLDKNSYSLCLKRQYCHSCLQSN
jgi:hypothetical protein